MAKTADALTHSDRIAKEIESEIISGRRAPGSHLNEQEIADRFSVSRTPVREAVRHLSSAGLVEVQPRRGAFVARIPVTRLIQMFETMTELEGACARLAARRMRVDEKRALERVHRAYEKFAAAGDADRYYDESLEFHRRIFKGAHNDVLGDMAMRLFNQLTGYRRRQLTNARRTSTSFDEHAAVLEAIMDGDEARSERLMRAHTGMVGDNVMDLIGQLPEG
ncbi:MAG: GntR family transcriptional regulator [Pseudomonadota bacterium]